MPSHDLNLFADYFQFYLQDESADGDLSDAWDSVAVQRMFAVSNGVVGIGTARNMNVPVKLELLDSEPVPDFANFDHVVEGALHIKSGSLVMAGCTDYFPDAARFDVGTGTYRVRLSASGLSTLSEGGLDGQDRYRVQLWQAAYVEPTILKQRAV
jgi:hypothetical protein